MYSILPVCTPAGQKRAPDLITYGCEPPCDCWELNSGPLEQQPVLLTSEPSLQSLVWEVSKTLSGRCQILSQRIFATDQPKDHGSVNCLRFKLGEKLVIFVVVA